MYYVYVILSRKRPWRYVGITENPKRRLIEHNSGQTKSTVCYAPFRMIVLRQQDNFADARKSEKYFKSGYGRKHLDRVLRDMDDSDHPVTRLDL